jgi:hypothetical protein
MPMGPKPSLAGVECLLEIVNKGPGANRSTLKVGFEKAK